MNKEAFMKLFNTEEGFEILQYLYRISGFKGKRGNDPNELLYQAGRQDLVRSIMSLAGISEQALISGNQFAGLGKKVSDHFSSKDKKAQAMGKEARISEYRKMIESGKPALE